MSTAKKFFTRREKSSLRARTTKGMVGFVDLGGMDAYPHARTILKKQSRKTARQQARLLCAS